MNLASIEIPNAKVLRKRKFTEEQRIKIRAYHRALYVLNREKYKARRLYYHKANREKSLLLMAIYRQNNKSKLKEGQRKYRQSNKLKIQIRKLNYRKNNPEKVAFAIKRWRLTNPVRHRATMGIILRRRRARKYTNSTHEQIASAEAKIKIMLSAERTDCAYCSESFLTTKMQIDHILALARGGAHSGENVTMACVDCNRSKGCKLLYSEWTPPNIQ